MKMEAENGKTGRREDGNGELSVVPSSRYPAFPPSEVRTLANWKQVGATLFSTLNTMPWWLGDWYIAGLELARQEWERAEAGRAGGRRAEPTQLDLAGLVRKLFHAGGRAWKTAQNAAAVCRAFPASRRRESLSYGHHESLAALPAKDQNRWLDRAEASEWSVADLREAVRASKLPRGALQPAGRLYILSAEVAEMMRWLKAQDLDDPPGRREAIKAELAPLVEFAGEL